MCIPAPALEEHIDAQPAGDLYLRTSPELHMKRLLCQGYERIFQMGPCFRAGESGMHHSPEFSMLEWYRTDADYNDILEDTRELFMTVARLTTGSGHIEYRGARIDLEQSWMQFSVAQAFEQFAGWNPILHYDSERFELDLVEKVEPQLPRDRPVVLRDYPPELAALARCRAEDPVVAERWELYIGGLELANSYSELNDPKEQRRRFEDAASKRQRREAEVYPLDHDFMQALEKGMPPAGGIALGLDRLVMLFTDSSDISEVVVS